MMKMHTRSLLVLSLALLALPTALVAADEKIDPEAEAAVASNVTPEPEPEPQRAQPLTPLPGSPAPVPTPDLTLTIQPVGFRQTGPTSGVVDCTYQLVNNSNADVIVLDVPGQMPYFRLADPNSVVVSYAVDQLKDDSVDYYGFFVPDQLRVFAGDVSTGTFRVNVPVVESGHYQVPNPALTIPVSRTLNITMTMGYGKDVFSADPSGYTIAKEFFDWQQIVTSNTIKVDLPF